MKNVGITPFHIKTEFKPLVFIRSLFEVHFFIFGKKKLIFKRDNYIFPLACCLDFDKCSGQPGAQSRGRLRHMFLRNMKSSSTPASRHAAQVLAFFGFRRLNSPTKASERGWGLQRLAGRSSYPDRVWPWRSLPKLPDFAIEFASGYLLD